jgi:hypothetical protein
LLYGLGGTDYDALRVEDMQVVYEAVVGHFANPAIQGESMLISSFTTYLKCNDMCGEEGKGRFLTILIHSRLSLFRNTPKSAHSKNFRPAVEVIS